MKHQMYIAAIIIWLVYLAKGKIIFFWKKLGLIVMLVRQQRKIHETSYIYPFSLTWMLIYLLDGASCDYWLIMNLVFVSIMLLDKMQRFCFHLSPRNTTKIYKSLQSPYFFNWNRRQRPEQITKSATQAGIFS